MLNNATTTATAPPVRGFRRTGILSRYVMREIAAPTLLALIPIGFLVAPSNELRENASLLPLEFITWWDTVRLLAYFFPTVIAYVIPVTYMMGILFAFGRLAQNSEVIAMKAAGVPLKRVVAPVIILGAILSVMCFWLQDRVQPAANARADRLLYQELPERVTLEVLPTGIMHTIEGSDVSFRVYFRDRDVDTKTLLDVEVMESAADGSQRVFFAESARFVTDLDRPGLILGNGYLFERQEGAAALPIPFERLALQLPQMRNQRSPDRRDRMVFEELLAEERKLTERHAVSPNRGNETELRRTRYDIAHRIGLSLACLAVSLAAAPLAVRFPTSGRSFSFALGFSLALLYYVVNILLEPRSLVSMPETILCAMAPNIVLGVLGLWALWRVDRV